MQETKKDKKALLPSKTLFPDEKLIPSDGNGDNPFDPLQYFRHIFTLFNEESYLRDGRKKAIGIAGEDIWTEVRSRALEVIDYYTNGVATKNKGHGIDTFTEREKYCFIKALFAQINYFVVNGLIQENAPVEGNVGDASINNAVVIVERYVLSKEANKFLTASGLLYRAISKNTNVPYQNRVPKFGEID